MKSLLFVLTLGLTACQSAPSILPLPVPERPRPEPVAAPVLPTVPAVNPQLEARIRQQAQYVEALLSQNEALTAQLAAGATPPMAAATQALPAPSPSVPLTPARPATWLAPNAEGVIDLVAASHRDQPGEPVNPFAVRTIPEGATREVTMVVNAVVAGPTPCAVVNDRLLRPGESAESLVIERIDGDAVIFRAEGQELRLPVSEKKIRIRLLP
jgi:hypothetical protein